MDAISALHQRVSCPLLTEPAPTTEQVDALIQAALRAPDHACLRPWRFIVIEGEARDEFGYLLAQVARHKDPEIEEGALTKLRNKPLRAPMIIVTVACLTEHPKVPQIEQIIAAGAAANNIVTAAFALGLGAYWRTGSNAYEAEVKRGLGLANNEEITGFIYLGTPNSPLKRLPKLAPEDFTTHWKGNAR